MEAIKSLLVGSAGAGRALARAMQDPDPKLAESAIGLVATYGIGQAVQPLLGLLAARLAGAPSLGAPAGAAHSACWPMPRRSPSSTGCTCVNVGCRPAAEERLAAFGPGGIQRGGDAALRRARSEVADAAVRAVCRALGEGKIRAPEREVEE